MRKPEASSIELLEMTRRLRVLVACWLDPLESPDIMVEVMLPNWTSLELMASRMIANVITVLAGSLPAQPHPHQICQILADMNVLGLTDESMIPVPE